MTRGERLLEGARQAATNQQRQDRISALHRQLDRLLDEQDTLAARGWPTGAQAHRRGTITAAIQSVRQEITGLEAAIEVERLFNLPPVAEQAATPWRPGPSWRL